MSPPSVRSHAVPSQSQGDESQESRQSREGQADPVVPQHLETQAGRDVNPAQRVRRERARTRCARKDGGGERSEGRKTMEASTRAARKGRAAERARRREQGPEAGRVRTHLKERGESTR